MRAAIKSLGLPAREIAADPQLRGALCDWSQVAAPRLLLVLTGHFDLCIGAIRAHGDGSAYQQECLADLDTGAALGVLMLTELAGTNGNDHQTTATWDPNGKDGKAGFWLNTPAAGAVKFMPNVADPSTPKITVVTARLIVEGRDEGILLFLLRLRTPQGLAEGVEVVRLPDKTSAPMDHAMIRFNRVWLPREALLGGNWARMTEDGRFECDLPPSRRFHQAIGVLGDGRLDLANAAISSARAALAALANYIPQRRSGSGTSMADRDAVHQDLAPAVAAVYATSILGRRIRDMLAQSAMGAERPVWAMLAKPLLSYTAHNVLTICRWRAASQGILRNNYIVDWIGNLEAIITAEGENQILQITAGKVGVDLTALRLPRTPQELPWYIDLLVRRERIIADGLNAGDHTVAGAVQGPDSAIIELTTTTAERLATTALFIAALETNDQFTREVLLSAAQAYALDRIKQHGLWYVAHQLITPERAGTLSELLSHHQSVLAKHLLLLVDAFQIPPLPAPLFSPDYIPAWISYANWGDLREAASQ
ncbi:acyl-CoA dehydrogenase family protein [Nocardia paucivorans]|uniref:acyl-CoA dehydrogenase family protein n=1 Tax=Nocardia paucivorans TaxID=114259 RepID=UPI001C3F447C|nr:acyl-CoA dehydrogenase family protein [Nocardia paucivorans]